MNKDTLIFAGTQRVGRVRDGVFYKNVDERHLLRRPPAIAWDMRAWEQAKAAGAIRVCVCVRETGREYRADVTTVEARGFRFDRGWGQQIALPLTLFDGAKKDAGQAVAAARPADSKPVSVQLEMAL